MQEDRLIPYAHRGTVLSVRLSKRIEKVYIPFHIPHVLSHTEDSASSIHFSHQLASQQVTTNPY